MAGLALSPVAGAVLACVVAAVVLGVGIYKYDEAEGVTSTAGAVRSQALACDENSSVAAFRRPGVAARLASPANESCGSGSRLRYDSAEGVYVCSDAPWLSLPACSQGQFIVGDGGQALACADAPQPPTPQHVVINSSRSNCSQAHNVVADGAAGFVCSNASALDVVRLPAPACQAGKGIALAGNGSVVCAPTAFESPEGALYVNTSLCTPGDVFEFAGGSPHCTDPVRLLVPLSLSASSLAAAGDVTVGGNCDVDGGLTAGALATDGVVVTNTATLAGSVHVSGGLEANSVLLVEGGARAGNATHTLMDASDGMMAVQELVFGLGGDAELQDTQSATVVRAATNSVAGPREVLVPDGYVDLVGIAGGSDACLHGDSPHYDAALRGWTCRSARQASRRRFPRVGDGEVAPHPPLRHSSRAEANELGQPKVLAPGDIDPNGLLPPTFIVVPVPEYDYAVIFGPDTAPAVLDLETRTVVPRLVNWGFVRRADYDYGGVYVHKYQVIVLTPRYDAFVNPPRLQSLLVTVSADRNVDRRGQRFTIPGPDGLGPADGGYRPEINGCVGAGMYVPHQDAVYFTPGTARPYVDGAPSWLPLLYNFTVDYQHPYNDSYVGDVPAFNAGAYLQSAQRIYFATSHLSVETVAGLYYLDVSGSNHNLYVMQTDPVVPQDRVVAYVPSMDAVHYVPPPGEGGFVLPGGASTGSPLAVAGVHEGSATAYGGAIRPRLGSKLYFVPYDDANATEWLAYDYHTGAFETYASAGNYEQRGISGAFYDDKRHCLWFYPHNATTGSWTTMCADPMLRVPPSLSRWGAPVSQSIIPLNI